MGLLRSGRIGNGSNINDITVGLQKKGVLLRLDSISLGRDANMNTGTVVLYLLLCNNSNTAKSPDFFNLMW